MTGLHSQEQLPPQPQTRSEIEFPPALGCTLEWHN